MDMNESKQPYIVAIEDNPFDQELIQAALNRDFRVTCVNGASEYEKTISGLTPDLILLDILLSEDNGLELFHKIKSAKKTSATPIFFLTACNQRDDKVKGLGLGAED